MFRAEKNVTKAKVRQRGRVGGMERVCVCVRERGRERERERKRERERERERLFGAQKRQIVKADLTSTSTNLSIFPY